MDKLSFFFPDFVLSSKEKYPRFQVVNLDTQTQYNIDVFLSELTDIIASHQHLVSVKDPAMKQSDLLNMKKQLYVPQNDLPHFHLAMCRDDALTNGKNVDVKKIEKAIASIAKEAPALSLKNLLNLLVETYTTILEVGMLRGAPDIDHIKHIRDDCLKMLTEAAGDAAVSEILHSQDGYLQSNSAPASINMVQKPTTAPPLRLLGCQAPKVPPPPPTQQPSWTLTSSPEMSGTNAITAALASLSTRKQLEEPAPASTFTSDLADKIKNSNITKADQLALSTAHTKGLQVNPFCLKILSDLCELQEDFQSEFCFHGTVSLHEPDICLLT